jgi:hypothetical protein
MRIVAFIQRKIDERGWFRWIDGTVLVPVGDEFRVFGPRIDLVAIDVATAVSAVNASFRWRSFFDDR